MSAAQRWYEVTGCLFNFCADRLELLAHTKKRSTAFMPPIAPKRPANEPR